MKDEPIRIHKSDHIYYRFISIQNIRIPLLFLVGSLIAIITNCIGNGSFTKREILYLEASVSNIFISDRHAFEVFIALIRQSASDLIYTVLAFTASITLFSKTFITLLTIIKGFALGRIFGCIIYLNKQNILIETVEHPVLSSLTAVIYFISVNIVYIFYCSSIYSTIEQYKKADGISEMSLLLSSESAKRLNSTLSALGTIILFSLMKSFLLLLISLI